MLKPEKSYTKGWGTYLLSRAAWIVDYRWRRKITQFFPLKIYPHLPV